MIKKINTFSNNKFLQPIFVIIFCLLFIHPVRADSTERDENGVVKHYENGITSYVSDETTFAKFHEYGMNITDYWEKLLNSYKSTIPAWAPLYTTLAQESQNLDNPLSGWGSIVLWDSEHSFSSCLVTGPSINTDRPGYYTGSLFLYASLPKNGSFTAYLTADGAGILASHKFVSTEANDQSSVNGRDDVQFRNLNSAVDSPTPLILPVALTYYSPTPLQNIQIKICEVSAYLLIVHQTILDYKYVN
jgi:hypothetical protein